METKSQSIKLTQTVQKGGCAAKIAATTLRQVLSQIDIPNRHPNLLVSGKTLDDAAVYKISEELALVETLDFFTPIVDTPYLYGKVAAVNALSDIYAMGGRPKTCLAILAFPLLHLGEEVMKEVLAGASEAIAEAQALLVGGHSIDDDTLKFGLSVTGLIHPQKIWSNAGAKPGDVLLLTKPLGTGTLMAGLKKGQYTEDQLKEALTSMTTLNNILDILSESDLSSISAATDITGYGLVGHAMQMAQASDVTIEIQGRTLPIFSLVPESLEHGNLTKAHRTNREYTEKQTSFQVELTEAERQVLFDPQTSGGLLLSVNAQMAPKILEKLQMSSFPWAKEIGRVTENKGHPLHVY